MARFQFCQFTLSRRGIWKQEIKPGAFSFSGKCEFFSAESSLLTGNQFIKRTGTAGNHK